MIARDYQAECLTAIRDAFAAGIWSQVVVLPTGSGKTVIFALMPAALAAFLDAYPWFRRRVLVIAHRDALLEQAAQKIRAANPDLNVEIEKGDMRATPMADIVVASVQTLAPRNCARLEQMNPDRFRVVVVDEAHHAAADSYQRPLRVLGLVPPEALLPGRGDDPAIARARVQDWWSATNPERLLLGFTATPARSDAIGLEWTFRQVTYEKSLRWMIERAYLVPPKGFLVETDLNLDTVKTIGGDFQTTALAHAVNTTERNHLLLAAWADRARMRKTIAFAVDVQHAKDLADLWTAHGFAAEAVYGELEQDAQRAALARFAAGTTGQLMNCQLLTEGYDEPSIGCVLIARPTQSHALYMQMVGRGLRLHATKSDCLVLDGADNAKKHSLVTLGDLFGLPRRFNLDGASAVTVALEFERLAADNAGIDLTNATTIAEARARVKAVDLWATRPSKALEHASLKWVHESEQRFHLSVPALVAGRLDVTSRERIIVEQGTLGGWRVFIRGGREKVDGDFPIAMADDAADGLRRAERWVSMNRAHLVAMKAKDAPWRNRPPTTRQIEALQRMGVKQMPATRGDASDLFDLIGGRRRA